MKSGLKDCEIVVMLVVDMVATYAAMKSGLKVLVVNPLKLLAVSSNLCRDEKRTERRGFTFDL